MTVLFNDPATFAEDQFAGFLDLYADRLRGVAGGAVAHRGGIPEVAVVVGGGSGHYPAFCGLVGPGLAAGAVVGNIFTSPSAAQVYSVAKAANQGRGVMLTFGNYAGDIMNFGVAADRLRSEGIDTRVVIVTDDVASSPVETERRGIAGDFTVFKAMGAAASAGLDLDEVERIGRAANAATRSFGVAFSGCTLPGATEPLFSVPTGTMGVGLGIHGEPGIRDEPMMSADGLAQVLVSELLRAAPADPPSRVAVVLNGLGTTKYEELFLLWNSIAPRLRAEGLTIVDPEVGELVTSLDMGGCSLTLMWLDDELEQMWSADAYTPAYRKQRASLREVHESVTSASEETHDLIPDATDAAAALSPLVVTGLESLLASVREHETELGRIDAVAGDGDHGRGMVRGAEAAFAAAARAAEGGAGAGWTLRAAGRGWAAAAGGTSGVLWGAGLEAAGVALGDARTEYAPAHLMHAARAFAQAISQLGGASVGDKTMLDALEPFVDALASGIEGGLSPQASWRAAARAAVIAADETAPLRPRRGRARPLADKSVGTPDAGAISFSQIVMAIGQAITTIERNPA